MPAKEEEYRKDVVLIHPPAEIDRKRRARESSDDEDEQKPPIETTKKKAAPKRRQPPKRARCTVNPFIADDVEVDDDDEEEDEYDGEWVDEPSGMSAAERREAERALQDQADALRAPARRNPLAHMNEEEMAAYFEERHQQQREMNRQTDGGTDFNDDITQISNLPTTADPSLWMIKCRPGKEKTVLLQLLRKCIAFENQNDPLNVSTIYWTNLKQILYVEARRKACVSRLIEGVWDVDKRKIQLIPLKEMPDTLRVINRKPSLKVDDFVRVQCGIHKGDLAQVDCVEVEEKRVHVRILPRIDYAKKKRDFDKKQAAIDILIKDEAYDEVQVVEHKEAPSKGGPKVRPPAAPFNADRIAETGGRIEEDGDFVLWGSRRFRRGLEYRNFPLDSVTIDGVTPAMSELVHFTQRLPNGPEFLEELAQTKITGDPIVFAAGDLVRVVAGELVNLQGRVHSTEIDGVIVLPEHAELKKPLKFPPNELRKIFAVGDHVQIVGGRHEGSSGTVVSAGEDELVVLCDLNYEHIKVRPQNVRVDARVSSGVERCGAFRFHDLVAIDSNKVGVVVRMEREHVEVVDMSGQVLRLKASGLQPRQVRLARCYDSGGNTLQAGETVRLLPECPAPSDAFRGQTERTARIKYVFHTVLFLYCPQYLQNGGIFTVRAKAVVLVGGEANLKPKKESAQQPEGLQSPRHVAVSRAAFGTSGAINSPTQQQSGAHLFPSRSGGPTPQRDVSLLGKTVRITAGPMKGYWGTVKYANDVTAKVELHAQPKTIMVDRKRVFVVPPGGTSTIQPAASLFACGPPTFESIVPMFGAGAHTPMHESQALFLDSQVLSIGTPSVFNPDSVEEEFPSTPQQMPPPASPVGSRSGDAEIPEEILASGGWCALDLCVEVMDTYEDDSIRGAEGVVRDVRSDSVDLYFEQLEFHALGPDRTVPPRHLLPVQPRLADKARVIYGNDEGALGVIKESERGCLLLEMEGGNVRAIPAKNLCKIY